MIESVSQFQTLSKKSRDVQYGNGIMIFFLIALEAALMYSSGSASNLFVVTIVNGADY